jgi:hypothetical protein
MPMLLLVSFYYFCNLLCLSVDVVEGFSTMGQKFGAPLKEDEAVSQLSSKKKGKKRQNEKWSIIKDTFQNLLLDESFLQLPVRSTTVNAAMQYTTEADTPHLMPGTHKHLGGAYDPETGSIFGVPANSKCILCLQPVWQDGSVTHYQPSVISLPPEIADQKMKWLRGIVHNGYLWAIPSWASAVLCVNLATHQVELLPLPEEVHEQQNPWQWHGGGMNPTKTAIYCIPSNAKHVLKVDMITKTTSLVDIDITAYPGMDLSIPNKWYGGIAGKDGCIYGIPYRAGAILQIDDQGARCVGPFYGLDRYNWHGGICVDGSIYAHPSHANTVLVIDTNVSPPHIKELPIQVHDDSIDITSQTYKWLGGAVGVDGNIYHPACDTSVVLKIDIKAQTCSTFGFAGESRNKWQGGLLARDGCIYCIPANGQHVLRIHTANGRNEVQLLGDLPAHKDKWQGGSMGKDGCLYFIPENGYRVLKITPPGSMASTPLREDDVRIEFV